MYDDLALRAQIPAREALGSRRAGAQGHGRTEPGNTSCAAELSNPFGSAGIDRRPEGTMQQAKRRRRRRRTARGPRRPRRRGGRCPRQGQPRWWWSSPRRKRRPSRSTWGGLRSEGFGRPCDGPAEEQDRRDIENGFEPSSEVIEAKKRWWRTQGGERRRRGSCCWPPTRTARARPSPGTSNEQLKRTKIPAQRILFNEITRGIQESTPEAAAAQPDLTNRNPLRRDLRSASAARRRARRMASPRGPGRWPAAGAPPSSPPP